jgi:SAM-dependent methyltransferase
VLWPLPSTDDINTFYSSDYFNFDRRAQEAGGRYYARKISRLKPIGRFLDVGCATGFFINGIRSRSPWSVHGVEMGEKAASYAKDTLGLDVRQGSLEEAKFESGTFDFIRFNNVLEHVTDPLALLSEGGKLLCHGGLLELAVPNGLNDRQGFLDYYQLRGERGLSKDGHLYFFSSTSLEHLVHKAGLKIRQSYSASLKGGLRARKLWPRKKSWPVPYLGRQAKGPADSVDDAIVEGRAYPEVYYAFKNAQDEFLRWPGLSNYYYNFFLRLEKA